MDPIILRFAKEVLRQVRLRIWALMIAMTVISFAIMLGGTLYEPKYETSVTVFADNQNVIKPLLEGQAAVTVPKSERLRIVQEIMFSPRILEEVVRGSFGESGYRPGSQELEQAMQRLRREVTLSAPASNYISVSYADADPEISFQVVNRITNLFIEESAKTKRIESKSAYDFIDEQVKSYKSQLVEAENRLKAFEAANVDGVESQVTSAIQRLQAMIDETEVDIEATQVRINALEEQLDKEGRYVTSNYSARVYRERLARLESQLETLLLNYREDHPDVIELRYQIQDVKRTIVEVENSTQQSDTEDLSSERRLNPIYEELSNQLSEARVNLQTMKHRLAANQERLEQQYERRRRVAVNQAELSELTRDYDVTKGIYEDLLERKERARISMTLDLAGQGVTYKVLEPAVFPTVPTGLNFVHFAAMGPLVGVLVPLALLIAWLWFDPRIRFEEQLDEAYPGIVLAVIPSPQAKYPGWRNVMIFLSCMVAGYTGIAVTVQIA